MMELLPGEWSFSIWSSIALGFIDSDGGSAREQKRNWGIHTFTLNGSIIDCDVCIFVYLYVTDYI